jgi:hypothetical protein
VIKRISLLIAAALMAATMVVATAVPAFAQSRAERECVERGGTFVQTGPGQHECRVTTTTETNPGNPQSENAAKPKKSTQTDTQPQQGQGIGGGAQGTPTEQNCQYNNAGKLQESKSDEGCPQTFPG